MRKILHKSPLWLALFVSHTSISYAFAETAMPDSTLETIVVNVKNDNKKAYATSAMGTTTGILLSPRQTPQSVSVITKAQLDDQGATTLADALKKTTGVNVVIDKGIYRFQSRGFFIDRVEEDGIASTVEGATLGTDADAQHASDISVYDHIEVVRGPTGLTQAYGSSGGTVNAVFKKPTARKQFTASLQGNRFNDIRGSIDVSSALNESKTIRGRAVITGERLDSFRDRESGHKGVFYGVLSGDIGDKTTWYLGSLYQNQHNKPNKTGLPLQSDGSSYNLPLKTNLSANWNDESYSKSNIFGELIHNLNDSWKLTTKISYQHDTSDSKYGTLTKAATAGDNHLLLNNYTW